MNRIAKLSAAVAIVAACFSGAASAYCIEKQPTYRLPGPEKNFGFKNQDDLEMQIKLAVMADRRMDCQIAAVNWFKEHALDVGTSKGREEFLRTARLYIGSVAADADLAVTQDRTRMQEQHRQDAVTDELRGIRRELERSRIDSVGRGFDCIRIDKDILHCD